MHAYRFTLTFVSAAALSAQRNDLFQADSASPEISASAVSRRDEVFDGILHRACHERLPVNRAGGGQRIPPQQKIAAIALCKVPCDVADDALATAQWLWGERALLGQASRAGDNIVLTFLLVPSVTGMRAKREFDPHYHVRTSKPRRNPADCETARSRRATQAQNRSYVISVRISQDGSSGPPVYSDACHLSAEGRNRGVDTERRIRSTNWVHMAADLMIRLWGTGLCWESSRPSQFLVSL